MPYNEKLAERVRNVLLRSETDIEEKRMFGGICFMVDGKMCVGVESERMMVRFAPERAAEIFARKGALPMDFTGRVMKGFAFVDVAVLQTDDELEYWVALALQFNKTAKAAKKRRA